MFPLFETICVKEGKIQHAYWHQKRFEYASKMYFGSPAQISLFNDVIIPKKYRNGLVKMKVLYNAFEKQVSFEDYNLSTINTLKLIEDNTIDYHLKYSDREHLNTLYLKKENCDDILIVQNDKITDTSYCNIVFHDGHSWRTPKSTLLKGTARQRLLHKAVINEREIMVKDINQFTSFKLINAMRDFHEVPESPVSNISF